MKFIEHFPVPLIFTTILFSVFPAWPAAFIFAVAFVFIGFKTWIAEKDKQQIKLLNERMDRIQGVVESIQIARTIGR
jgi:hypothetical protein